MTSTLPAATDTTTAGDTDASPPDWTPIVAAQLEPGHVIRQGTAVGEVRAVEPVDHHAGRLMILFAGGTTATPRGTDFYELATEPAAARWRQQQAQTRRRRALARAFSVLASRFERDELPSPAWLLHIYLHVDTAAEVEQAAATLGVAVETTDHGVRAVFTDDVLEVLCSGPRPEADADGEQ